MNFFTHFGRYLILIKGAFGKPLDHKYFRKQIIEELVGIGLSSVGIVFIISAFMGAVLVLQTGYQIENPLIPLFTIGYGLRESVILEFSPTIVTLILAGKVGSSVASHIGTMRVTEQIDAIDIMGINSAQHLILPKIVAAVISFPLLIILSMIVAMTGGYVAAVAWGIVSHNDFVQGLNYYFYPFEIVYAIVKTTVFAFIIVSISSYQGYYVKGGAIDVGSASTRAVVYSSIAILLTNLVITKVMLA
jgi:phospholipid/cholesterol/gamma-HCH transport system permease protein